MKGKDNPRKTTPTFRNSLPHPLGASGKWIGTWLRIKKAIIILNPDAAVAVTRYGRGDIFSQWRWRVSKIPLNPRPNIAVLITNLNPSAIASEGVLGLKS